MMDETTGRIFLRKRLEIYNREVYLWLHSHKNRHVPGIRAVREEDGTLIVTEEYIQGETLKDYLDHHTPDEKEKKRILLEVLEGLEFLHSAEPPIIHRDLKPANIMVTDDGVVKIVDYDAAKTFRPGAERDTVLMGTAGSAAPEQYGFGPSDERTDIYAVGILIREMGLTGHFWEKIASRCTEMKPGDRYSDAAALKRAILKSGRGINRAFSLPIPGFRAGNPFYALLAILFYVIMFGTCFTMVVNSAVTPLEIWANRITAAIIVASWVDLFTGWTHIYDRFPFMKGETWIKRLPGYLFNAALILAFWILMLVMFLEFFKR